MKQQIALILIALSLVHLAGCQKDVPAPVGTAFYYCVTDINFSMDSTAIRAEYRENAAQDSLQQILAKYLAGPASSELRSPFPNGIKLVEARMDGKTVFLTLNDALASLSGLELTLACSCLSLTCLDFNGADQVVISAQNALLDGQKTITMDQNTLLLLDTVLEGE